MTPSRICFRCGFPLPASGEIAGICARCLAQSVCGVPDAPGDGTPTVATLPRNFGGYELLDEIGRGGMGVVYRARQIALDRLVALKLLVSGVYSSEALLARFRQEAAAAAALHHPNLVPVYDYGECEGQPYYAMELIVGRDMARVCDGRPLTAGHAADILRQLATALHYAHGLGIVHRDLKPSNVLIDEAGEPHIADFGLARRLDRSSNATVIGQMLGSPSYASPEQASGRTAEIGVAADVYGVGALFYHLLTGRPPFNAATPTETLRLVLETPPAPPRLLNPGVPRDLETICLVCLAKEPTRRYATAGAIAEDCERYFSQRPIRARRPSVAYRTRKFLRRHRLACAAAMAIVVLATAGLTMVIRTWRAESNARQRRAQIEQIFNQALHVADPGYSRGRQATLKELLDETARWVPGAFADDPRLVADLRARIGATYCKLSLFESAVPHLEAAWAIRRELLPEEHPDYLQSLRDLGALRVWQQRYPEAEVHLGRVLAIQERTLGRDAEETLRTRDEIAYGRDVRLTLGVGFDRRERANFIEQHQRFAREGYDLARRRWGDEHPLTLAQEANCAVALLRGRTAQREQAERMLAHNYEVSGRVLGLDHPRTFDAMAEWGRALRLLNRNDEALKLLESGVPRAERALGTDHLVTAWAMQQWEAALRNAGRGGEANALVPRYVTGWMRTYGPANRWVVSFAFRMLHRLATSYGQPELAAATALDRLSELRDGLHLPPTSPAIGVMHLVLADARLTQGRTAEAGQHLRQAEVALRDGHSVSPELCLGYVDFANHYREQKEFGAAETMLSSAEQGVADATPGDRITATAKTEVLTALVRLYTDWNQPAKAAEFQQKLDAFTRGPTNSNQ